jgi:deferrochelatase/peroxidase EfeB
MDLVERKEIKVDEIERTEVKEAESVAGRFAAKNRKLVSKIFTKRATNN